MALTREQIREANDSNAIEFEIPEWGDTILLACPSVRRMSELADAGGEVSPVTVLIACAVDPDGAPLFTDEDREWLEDKNAGVVGRIVKRLTQMFEDIEGNLKSATAGASSSD